MKKINTTTPTFYSNNVYERFAAFFLDVRTVEAMRNRYRAFYTIAKKFRYGDTFISDYLRTVNGSTLSYYISELNDRYKCDFLKVMSHRGDAIRDNENDRIIAISSCNVYLFNANPDVVLDILDDVKECFMKKFEM